MDMRHRMAIASERSRGLNHLWRDNRIPRSLKIRLYAASVCSTLTHGSEARILTQRALATLNGFNFCQLHRITGRSYREEATKPSYDLLTAVRTRRHHWLGYILRMPADRLVRRVVLAMGQRAGPWQPPDGHAPPHTRTSSASRRPPRMGTIWPIPLLPTGKPLRAETPQIIIIGIQGQRAYGLCKTRYVLN